MSKIRKRTKIQKKQTESPFKNYWDKTNYILLIAGIVIVFVGFYLMSVGEWNEHVSLTVAPLVLLLAYLIIFPLSIFYKKKKTE